MPASQALLALCLSSALLSAAGFSGFSPVLRPARLQSRSAWMVMTPERPQVGIGGVPSSEADKAVQRPSSKPPIGLWDILTKYSYGQQHPDVPFPIAVTPGQPPMHCDKITAEKLRTLERDGVVHIEGVLDEKWISYLREITEWQIRNPHIWCVPGVVSGLYDYIQRSTWTTNSGFAEFLYYSPVASALGQMASCGWFPEGDARGGHEVRISTDLLMVNPNKGFKWHQDNQNGPLTSGHGGALDALRFWITMDDTPATYGAPVYLRKSHENECVGKDEVFVDLEEGDLPKYARDLVEFRPKAGDMIIWHPRCIHKIDGAPDGCWGGNKRRVLGGTVAIDDAKYQGKKKALFSDMGRHDLTQGDPLVSPFFPIIYPQTDASERAARERGDVGRSFEGFGRMVRSLFSTENMVQFSSWAQVVSNAQKIKAVNDPFLRNNKD